jgi:hypothetical protein
MTKIANHDLYVATTGLTWEMVFNSNFIHWGFIDDTAEVALKSGYPYLLWNDLVYGIGVHGWYYTDFTRDDIK